KGIEFRKFVQMHPMKYFAPVLMLLLMACGQGKKYHPQGTELPDTPLLAEIIRFQQELDESFRDPETSPSPHRYRKYFDRLDFFEADTIFVVKARFERTPEAKPFFMPTTTDRKTWEVVYGIAHFTLDGSQYQLEVYQSLDLIDQEEFRDYLFLPFLDGTNGLETYGGGRYIDLSIPKGDTLIIDFNKAYNPYCVYDKKYSCPLVPRQNYLRTEVRAGVKDFNP